MYEIPTSVTIDNQEFKIRKNGDFRMVLDCFSILEDADISKQERVFSCLLIFYDGFRTLEDLNKLPNLNEAVEKMYKFFECNQKNVGANRNRKLLDWKDDEQLICSAVNKVVGQEIRLIPYMHWFTFMGYFNSVGESTLSQVISIRDKIARGKKLEDYEKDFRKDNPEYFVWEHRTEEEIEMDNYVRSLWDN